MNRILILFLAWLTIDSLWAKQPNIIFVLADDLGWAETTVPMIKGNDDTRSDFNQTPNVERLAQNMFICAPHVSQVAALAAMDCVEELLSLIHI